VVRIRDVFPDPRSDFFPSRIRIFSIFSIFPYGFGIRNLSPGSGKNSFRIQGSKRHRISDPQHCITVISVMWCLRFVTSTLCGTTFSNRSLSDVYFVMLRFAVVPKLLLDFFFLFKQYLVILKKVQFCRSGSITIQIRNTRFWSRFWSDSDPIPN
jgi:hypothetical protein